MWFLRYMQKQETRNGQHGWLLAEEIRNCNLRNVAGSTHNSRPRRAWTPDNWRFVTPAPHLTLTRRRAASIFAPCASSQCHSPSARWWGSALAAILINNSSNHEQSRPKIFSVIVHSCRIHVVHSNSSALGRLLLFYHFFPCRLQACQFGG